MIVLDCESRESALESIATIYGISKKELDSFLHSLDLEAHYAKTDPPHGYDRELRLHFESSFSIAPAPIDRVCWFHLTRTHPRSDFSDGILPLTNSLDRAWETILEVFRNTKHEKPLIEMRQNGVPDRHYQAKAGEPFHAGPYAMLVREIAMHPRKNGNHDYLWLPEIMEDICNGYKQAHGEMLHDELNRALVPMIVKFWSAKYCGDDCIEVALDYLYRTAHDRASFRIPNTCFEGENKAIPPEQILRVEVTEDHESRNEGVCSVPAKSAGFTIDFANGVFTISYDVEGK